ncbi:dihydrolipoamide acetyltransferase family protein [Agromyces binzhouensis]|uniref:dihydrolipoamide acetyltransferase family protein n=1 Tax=Agromyces binzhouensis TaxID=1817495 RepID=UPI003635D86A
MGTVVRMPAVLAGSTEAALQSWLVEEGAEVSLGMPIAEVETEKAVVEYESEAAGTVAGFLVPVGENVEVGTPILVLAEPGESAEAAMRAAGVEGSGSTDAAVETTTGPESTAATEHAPTGSVAESAREPSPDPAASRASAETAGTEAGDARPERRFASPIVRRMARERGLDLEGVRGTGPGGRIVRRDLEAAIAAEPSTGSRSEHSASEAADRPVPAEQTTDTAPPAGATDVPLTGMRRAIARRLTESVTTIPQFQVVADVRLDALLGMRAQVVEQVGVKVSVNDFVVKAVAGALVDVPEANAIWTDRAVRRFEHADIGIAVAIDGGLVTPVIRAVDRLSMGAVAAAGRDLAERARAGQLRQDELEGGSFAVSNLGMFGTKEFTAIINPPHSGILAVGAAGPRAIVVDGEVQVATVMTVTLSADHRVIDGALAARWMAALVERLEHPLGLML